MYENLSYNENRLFCLSCHSDLPNHGASCCALGVLEKGSMNKVQEVPKSSKFFEILID
jgi:hypothetical protein